MRGLGMNAGIAGRIFGIGLSKTGTTSLASALNQLGIRTIHWPHDPRTLSELSAGKYRLSILDKYQATVDLPIAIYYAQLDEEFPGSKFILTVRDLNAWLESARKHFSRPLDTTRMDVRTFSRATTYGTLGFNEQRFRFVYETHQRNVEAYFRHRPQDLLVLDICAGEGWEGLCPFLGASAPRRPFPHDNSTQRMAQWLTLIEQTKRDLSSLIEPEDRYILVDDHTMHWEAQPWTSAIPFLERNGSNLGPPRDSEQAIEEVHRLRADGAVLIAFASPSFWWLEHYSELNEHLRSSYPCRVHNERVIAFDLRA